MQDLCGKNCNYYVRRIIMTKYSNQVNQILVASETEEVRKKGKKSDSLGSTLKLMQALRDFQAEVEDAMEAVEDNELRTKIQGFDQPIDEMYSVLLEAAGNGIKSIRKRDGLDSQDDMEVEGEEGITKGPKEVVPEEHSFNPAIITSPQITSPISPLPPR